MILVQVNSNNDIFLSKALIQAFDKEKNLDFYIHFGSEDLLQKFGKVDCYYGTDLNYVLLNAHHFDVFISFMGLCHIGHFKGLFLIDFFKQINVPTIEIQHGLFQYGINNVDVNHGRGGFCEKLGEHIILPMKYEQDYLIKWAGKDGIGYIKSAYSDERYNKYSDYILITTNIHWNIYTDEERVTFVDMMIQLIKANPKINFIWKNHPCEYNLFKRLSKLKLKNLNVFNKNESSVIPAEALMPNCKFAISTASTTLIDYDLQKKKVLVFDSKAVKHMLDTIKCERFSTKSELEGKFSKILNGKSDVGIIDTRVSKLKKDVLVSKIKTIIENQENKWSLNIALAYVEKIKLWNYLNEKNKK